MKKKIILSTLAAIATVLSINLKAQQDTTRVMRDTVKVIRDTVRVKETGRVIHDTVRTYTAPTPKKEEYPLRRVEFGIRYMPTFTSLALNTYNGQTIQGEATISHGYGVMLAFNFSKHVGIQAEASYNAISQKYKDQNLDREVNINYINIPVLLSLNTDKTKPVNFNVVLGPQFGINAGSSFNTSGNGNTDTLHAVLAVKQSDIGFAYGAGFEFALNKPRTFRLDLGFRGVYGLVNIDESNTNGNTYNILVHASRKTYGGYAGLAFLF
jgi:hypothetical protein